MTHCDEVSMKELTDLLHGCKKTFSRDITLLKSAGARIRFSKRRGAFVLESRERAMPAVSKTAPGRLYLEKIIRLISMMDEMPDESPDLWYKSTFPGSSLRTMQRDFAIMNTIGYPVKYEREMFNSHDCGMNMPARRYYFDRSCGAYELPTFKSMKF
jgi:hypothetical protein